MKNLLLKDEGEWRPYEAHKQIWWDHWSIEKGWYEGGGKGKNIVIFRITSELLWGILESLIYEKDTITLEQEQTILMSGEA